MESAAAEKAFDKRGHRKVRNGIVVSDKMDKTVVVRLERLKKHPRYHKYIKVWKKVKAHDEENACGVGDRVQLIESRPMSKEKRWRVNSILEKAK